MGCTPEVAPYGPRDERNAKISRECIAEVQRSDYPIVKVHMSTGEPNERMNLICLVGTQT